MAWIHNGCSRAVVITGATSIGFGCGITLRHDGAGWARLPPNPAMPMTAGYGVDPQRLQQGSGDHRCDQ
ncbi:hypothetical protein C7E18_23205, partial [Stenotrophomonas maltophilia]